MHNGPCILGPLITLKDQLPENPLQHIGEPKRGQLIRSLHQATETKDELTIGNSAAGARGHCGRKYSQFVLLQGFQMLLDSDGLGLELSVELLFALV
jgi:hypothetical protein